MGDLQSRIKQAVAEAAVEQIQSGMVLGLGSGSTAALMIQALGEQLRQGRLENITAVPTSFQSQVLASRLAIPWWISTTWRPLIWPLTALMRWIPGFS